MEINKIIISRTDKIGDLVLSIPSFYMVKKMYPKSELIILVRNYNYDVVKNLPYVDRVIKIDDYEDKDLEREIREIGADIFISLFSDKKVARLARKSKAPYRIGPYSKLSSYFSYNKGIKQRRSKSVKNEAEYNLDLIRKVDYGLFDRNFEINTNIYYEEIHNKFAEEYLNKEGIDKKFILVHPFSGGSAKNIKDEQYVELIKYIMEKFESINLVLSGAEQDKERLIKIVEAVGLDRVKAFINSGSLLNLAAVIDKSEIFIGTSTGPTHIAGSLKKKIIGIYPIKATQAPTRWGVFGNNNVRYILPEGEVEEDYSTKDFISWGVKDIEKILEYIDEYLN
jgi:ADP-heptose:LPS heptosyltransferase